MKSISHLAIGLWLWLKNISTTSSNSDLSIKYKNDKDGGFRFFIKPQHLVWLSTYTKSQINWEPLETIASNVKTKIPLFSSLVSSVKPLFSSSSINSHRLSMKIVAILVILCRSTHQNHSNYVCVLIVLNLYSADTRIDVITLFNHLSLFVSYNVLKKKLKDIRISSITWIKAQGTNCKLVDMCDKFEYCENI